MGAYAGSLRGIKTSDDDDDDDDNQYSLRGIKACDDNDEGAGITPGNGQGIGFSMKILGFQGLGFFRKLLVKVLLRYRGSGVSGASDRMS